MPTLDGLRGCAVLLVLAQHFVALSPLLAAPLGTPKSYLRAAILPVTASGVDLFFVLSGFLIGGILIDDRDSPRLLRTFYLRRFLRIVPLAWVCVLVAWLVRPAGWPQLSSGPAPAWPFFTFTSNLTMAASNTWWLGWLTPLWSVAVEEQFYLMLPWLICALPARRVAWIGPALMVLAWTARAFVFVVAPDRLFACHLLMPCRLDAFGCGITAAWFVRSRWWDSWSRLGFSRWIALAVLAIGPATMIKWHEPEAAKASWGYTAYAAFYAVLLLQVYLAREPWLRRFFGAAWLRVYGKYSYFIYLFQVMLGSALVNLVFHRRWSNTTPVRIWEIVAVPILLLIPAFISWQVLEGPLLRFGKRFNY